MLLEANVSRPANPNRIMDSALADPLAPFPRTGKFGKKTRFSANLLEFLYDLRIVIWECLSTQVLVLLCAASACLVMATAPHFAGRHSRILCFVFVSVSFYRRLFGIVAELRRQRQAKGKQACCSHQSRIPVMRFFLPRPVLRCIRGALDRGEFFASSSASLSLSHSLLFFQSQSFPPVGSSLL